MIGQIVKADCGCILRIDEYKDEVMFGTCIKMSPQCKSKGFAPTQRLREKHLIEMTKEEKLEYL